MNTTSNTASNLAEYVRADVGIHVNVRILKRLTKVPVASINYSQRHQWSRLTRTH